MGQLGQLMMPDLYDSFQQGAQDGRETARRKTLAQYVQPALGGDQSALSKIYGVDPDAGIKVQGEAGKLREDAQGLLGDFTHTVSALADSGDLDSAKSYYQANIAAVERATGMKLGPQLDPGMIPHIKQIDSALNPQKQQPLMSIGNGTVFDPNKREVVYKGEPQLPGSIQELAYLKDHPDLMSVKERLAAAGRAPVSDNGKSSDWVVQPDAAGNIWRVNKLTGEAQQVRSDGGSPILNKQALTAQQAANAAEGAAASFKTALGTLNTLEKSPGLDAAVGMSSMLPTRPGSDAANFESQLESFKSQTFLPMVQNLRGMGALSDAEGSKLANAVGSLSLKQSESQFRKSIKTIRETLQAAEKRAQGNAQKVGAITGTTHDGGDIDALVAKYGAH